MTRLDWRPSPLALSLATVSATALVLAAISHRAELIAFAAPLLGALAGGWRVGPATVVVEAKRDVERCFEGEEVRVHVEARVDGTFDVMSIRPVLPAGLELVSEWTLRSTSWGRFAPGVEVTVRAAGGLLVASVVARPVEIRVYPRPGPLVSAVRPERLPDRIGVHIGRRSGDGVEFAGIRPYVAGDPLGRVNWAVSARLGRLHITERLAERATDVVVLIDTYPGARRPSLDLAVHGAAEVVQAALRRGDRAGVLALGGAVRWLSPDVGRRQFYRIADAVLDATPERVDTRPTGGRVPHKALPPGACVIAFTPLLDARIGLALQDLRKRGHAILVVDVLRDPPAAAGDDPLVVRLWRLERRGLHRDLASLGIPVVPWSKESTLDEALLPLARRPLPSGRPPR